MGLLERFLLKSCGINYLHTFVVVDIGIDPNYQVILGRPFMRQMKMIQDWGFNYLYLRQEQAITRINLKDHSYRDVTHSPVEEFDSLTTLEDSLSRYIKHKVEMLLWAQKSDEIHYKSLVGKWSIKVN